jgi:hypothetical protein
VTAPDPLDAVLAALTTEQQARICDRFTKQNPGWVGADAGDILETLSDYDSDLEVLEPFYDANPDITAHPAAEHAARALLWGRDGGYRRLDRDDLASLLDEVDRQTGATE